MVELNTVYELDEELGRGGYGYVYKARRRDNGELRAVKIMYKLNHNIMNRLNSLLSVMKSPSIYNMKMYDTGIYTWNNNKVMTVEMEYIDGKSLADYKMEGVVMNQEFIFDCFLDIAMGLEYLHSHGLAHRDVKPDNIIHTGDRFILIDYDRLCHTEDEDASGCYWDKDTPGSFSYVPPEFDEGDPRQYDIYALAIVVMELINNSERIDEYKMNISHDLVDAYYDTIEGRNTPNYEYLRRRYLITLYNYVITNQYADVLMDATYNHDDISDSIKYILDMCVQRDPNERLTSHELIEKLLSIVE